MVSTRVRIPQGDVGVEADADRALLRVEAVELGVVGRCQLDEVLQRDAPLRDAFREQDRQPRLDARDAVRHPAERGAPFGRQLALRARRSGTGNGPTRRSGTRPASSPPRWRPGSSASRGGGEQTYLAPLMSMFEALQVVGRQRDVLRAGLGVDLEAALCAQRICSIASRPETCTIMIGTSTSSAWLMARCAASRSTISGRETA